MAADDTLASFSAAPGGQPVIVICGPTASGKSETALLVAEQLGGEIVSADSMQVYRGMDIGTAKTPPELRRGIPHHLLDICEPWQRFSVADYQEQANRAIRSIIGRGRQPILCGGTGQYISALTKYLRFPEIAADPQLRADLAKIAQAEGTPALHHLLQQQDPDAAREIAPSDRKRIIRALEMLAQTGILRKQHLEKSRQEKPPFHYVIYGLTCERQQLYKRIDLRVLKMIESGLAAEAARLIGLGLPSDSTCLQAIGYKEMIPYLEGKTTLAEAIAQIQQATRRYAKRQLTWFRHTPGLIWLTDLSPEESSQMIIKSS